MRDLPLPPHVPPPPPSLPPLNSSTPLPGAQFGISSRGPSVNNRRQSHSGPFGPLLPNSDNQPPKPNTQDLRAQVEAAKRVYKAEKERYRQEREQRRREKLTHRPSVRNGTTAPVAQTEILGEREMVLDRTQQDVYPEVERLNVPRRSNTHLGHGPFRHLDRKPEDLTSRVIIRITKKLSDMGFSENAYPTLPEKIKDHMPLNGVISKEAEDDVVTTLLEELLATTSPRPNVASGSGQRDVDMGEAWH